MKSVTAFYDRYHRQNKGYRKVIGPHNFTYFYILDFLHSADMLQQLQGKKILDVGCGVGTLATFLATEGATVHGLDISARAITFAKRAARDLQLKNCTFEKGELKKGRHSYDVVISTEVIEHIPDDGLFLEQLISHLKPGGLLLLTTPSQNNWLFKLGFYKKFDAEVGHLRRYTEASLMQLIRNTTLRVKKVRSVEGPLRNVLFTTKLGFLIKGIRGPLVPIFHFFDQLSAKIAGASDIQLIAQKPKLAKR